MTTPRLRPSPPLTARPARVRWVAAAFVVVGAGWFVLMMFSYLDHFGVGAADQPVHDWAISLRTPVVTAILAFITTLTGPSWMTVITAVVGFGWMLLSREWRRPVLLMGAMTLAVLASTLIKHELSRARPDPVQMMLSVDQSYSFPSGHTLGTAVFAGSLAYLLAAHSSRKGAFGLGAALAVAFTALVAFTRLYLGYHWLTDVLASAGLALVFVAAVMAGDLLLSRNRPAEVREDSPTLRA
ncbi:phosphatase PAP2 family protein [Arthrobacter sp. RAF14]|uniref:phosphatase PAP2 family protein n=1 Tax=Arthrobacter sp. RAF14 TaxID=3233051 RepID=UPI003F902963